MRRRADVAWAIAVLWGLVLYQKINATGRYATLDNWLNSVPHSLHYPLRGGPVTVPASATAARALISSAATGAGSPAARAGAEPGSRPAGAGCGTARLAGARCQAVTPLPASTPRPGGNASARACRAAWRSSS